MPSMKSLVLGTAILVAACNGAEDVGGTPEDAMAIADAFLAALEAHDADAAWSLLYPPNREGLFGDDRAGFDALVARVDLSAASWDVVSAGDRDGRYHVTVRLDTRLVDDALDTFLDVVPGAAPDTADMQVDIEPLGGRAGVLGG